MSTCMTRSVSSGPADDRVELLLARELGEVATELVEHERAGRRPPRPGAAGAGGLPAFSAEPPGPW